MQDAPIKYKSVDDKLEYLPGLAGEFPISWDKEEHHDDDDGKEAGLAEDP